MRRILENYFKILGGIDTNHLVGQFEGLEKVQCQSLISWVNDGSHYAPDELYVAIGDNMAASYMKIFFKIFKVTRHDAHYKMMMGDDYVDLDPDELPDEPQDDVNANVDGHQVVSVVDAPDLPVLIHASSTIQADHAAPELTVPSAGEDRPEIDSDIPF